MGQRRLHRSLYSCLPPGRQATHLWLTFRVMGPRRRVGNFRTTTNAPTLPWNYTRRSNPWSPWTKSLLGTNLLLVRPGDVRDVFSLSFLLQQCFSWWFLHFTAVHPTPSHPTSHPAVRLSILPRKNGQRLTAGFLITSLCPFPFSTPSKISDSILFPMGKQLLPHQTCTKLIIRGHFRHLLGTKT